jgi:hypothetical protein
MRLDLPQALHRLDVPVESSDQGSIRHLHIPDLHDPIGTARGEEISSPRSLNIVEATPLSGSLVRMVDRLWVVLSERV